MPASLRKIVPHLWFNDNAHEAVRFYVSLFSDSQIISGTKIHGTPSGDVDIIRFDLHGQRFTAINGGPAFTFTDSLSLFVYCGADSEIERLYGKLSENGTVLMPLGRYDWSGRYAWVKDKYGLSWQLDVDDINHRQKIVPTLLFVNDKAGRVKEATAFYNSVFPASRLLMEWPWDKTAGMPEGALLFAQSDLSGYLFNAMSSNQRHDYDFNEAVSFMVYCEKQEEIDYYWERLSDGGNEQACGWLRDRFGISWQIVPVMMDEMMTTTNDERLAALTEAMLKMIKLDIRQLTDAYNKANR